MTKKRRLEPRHYKAIELLANNINGAMTKEQIAEKCGVSRQALYKWERWSEFQEELIRTVRAKSVAELGSVMQEVPRMIKEGQNSAMLRTWLQFMGALEDKVDVTVNDGNNVDVDEIKARVAELKRDN